MLDEIVESIVIKHSLVNKELILEEIVGDSIQEVKDYLNYTDEEELPNSCKSIIKEMIYHLN